MRMSFTLKKAMSKTNEKRILIFTVFTKPLYHYIADNIKINQ